MIEGLEILTPSEKGYKRTVEFEKWLVATMTASPDYKEENLKYLERHLESDEVFILMDGEATLLIGLEKTKVPMEKFKVYNVKKNTWHAIFMNDDAKIIIVENANTGMETSELYNLK